MAARCKHLNVKPDADGVMRVRKNSVHACGVPVAVPTLPASITKHYNFRWPPERGYVSASDCAECPLFETSK